MAKVRTFAGAVWCPWCGTRTLDADRQEQKAMHGAEYLCRLCGRGFTIGPSHRHEQAVQLFKAYRQLRPREGSQRNA